MTDNKNIKILDFPGEQKYLSGDALSRHVEAYLQNLPQQDKPRHNGLLGFFNLIQNVIRAKEEIDNVPEGKRLLVFADDPPESLDTEAITFYLQERSPGQFSQGSIGAGGVKEVVSHMRSMCQHPEHAGEKLVTMGKFYDNYIVFNIYARNDSTALRRFLWFENLMDGYQWYFRVHGIRAIETGVGKRERVTIGELELTRYPMYYFVRTEDIYQFGSQELKYLELNVRPNKEDFNA